MVGSHQQHGPNVFIYHLVKGERRWFVEGQYLALNDASSIKRAVGDTEKHPCGVTLMVVGDLNSDIAEPEGNKRNGAIIAALSDTGMEDMS